MRISYSAPAKVILSGEHSVVYGKPALVSAIDLVLTCTAIETSSKISDDLTQFISKTVLSHLKKKAILHKHKNIKLMFKSTIPSGRGLGSSAALSTASTAACLHIFTEQKPNKETINNIAYQIEKKFHANPSGVDTSTSCYGGLIFYRKEFEFLKTISSLNFKLPEKFEKNIFLIDSGKPKESTKEMVQFLGAEFNKNPKFVEEKLTEIEKITKKMTLSIIQENMNLFAECIQQNQQQLEDLQLVSQNTKDLIMKLRPFGMGKITGAGGKKLGSGFILFLSKNKKGLENYLQKNHIKYLRLKQNADGVAERAT